MFKKKSTRIRESFGDNVLQIVTTIILILVTIIIGYPLLFVISCSFSSDYALKTAQVVLWPVNFTFGGYKYVFNYDPVLIGFKNTVFYTATSLSLTMFLQILMAYPLSRRDYQGKSIILKIMVIAMMTGAGMIPVFILKKSLGLYNTVWAVILAGLVGIRNVFMLRTCFAHSIPYELFEAAKIDGANDFQCLVKLAIPLGKATISVLVLYSFVGCWNDYFNAMIYLNDDSLWPLQLVLRNILTSSESMSGDAMKELGTQVDKSKATGIEQIQYTLIVIATVPVLVIYTLIQKFFEKGVMIGSVKG